MSKTAPKLDYVTKADGWTAGQWRPKGTPLKLTEAQAKYENVSPLTIGVDLASGPDETVVAEVKPEPKKTSRRK